LDGEEDAGAGGLVAAAGAEVDGAEEAGEVTGVVPVAFEEVPHPASTRAVTAVRAATTANPRNVRGWGVNVTDPGYARRPNYTRRARVFTAPTVSGALA